MSLLNILEIGVNDVDEMMPLECYVKLAELDVKYFFWSVIETDKIIRRTSVERAFELLTRLCSARKYARVAALRELLEGALFTYGNLFGVPTETGSDDCVFMKKQNGQLLIKMNQMQHNTPNNIRSILHAGLIGKGLKVPTMDAAAPQPYVRDLFLGAINACCKCDVSNSINPNHPTSPNPFLFSSGHSEDHGWLHDCGPAIDRIHNTRRHVQWTSVAR